MSKHDWISDKARARTPGDPGVDDFPRWLADDAAARAQAAADQKLIDTVCAGQLTTSTLQDLLWTPANVNRMIDGAPLLHRIVRDCDLSTLILLISCKNKVAIDDVDAQGRTAVDIAIEEGLTEKAHYLVLYGGHPADELPDFLGKQSTSNHQMRVDDWLRKASYKRDADVVRRALMLGGDVNAKHDEGLSMMHRHALLLEPDMVRVYLEGGADITRPHSRGESTLELMWWVNTNRLSDDWYAMVDLLRDFGAPDDGFKTPREMSPADMLLPVPKGYGGSPVIDYLVHACDWPRVVQAMALMPPEGRESWLLSRSEILGSSPLMAFCHRDRLELVFDADLWRGARASMQRCWQAISATASAPSVIRANKPASFTGDHFARVMREMAVDEMREKRPRIVWKKAGP